jgi:hypothetical protein
MIRRTLLLGAVLTALTAVPAAAAPSIAVDAACYFGGRPVAITGTGFTPGGNVFLGGGPGISLNGAAGASGGFGARVAAPSPNGTGPGVTTFQITATDDATGATVNVPLRVTNLAVATSGGFSEVTRKRSWSLSGWFQRRGPLYAHYRYKGRTVRTVRLGTPRPPCGTLSLRRPLIPVKRAKAGTWKVQVDHRRGYGAKTLPRWNGNVNVITVPR